MVHTFEQYKNAFHKWAKNFTRRELGLEIEEFDELQEWKEKSEEEFVEFCREKILPHLNLFKEEANQPRVLDLMIEGAALQNSDFTEFLMALKENENDRCIFFDYLQLFCTYC